MCKAGQLAPGAGPWPCAAGVLCLLRFAPNGVLAAFVHRAWAMGLPLWARAGASFFFCAVRRRPGRLPAAESREGHAQCPAAFLFSHAGARFPAGRLRGSGAGPEAAPGRAL